MRSITPTPTRKSRPRPDRAPSRRPARNYGPLERLADGLSWREKSTASRIRSPHALCHDLHVGPTILIVDDHASFRSTARFLLESEGLAVVGEAATGAEAVQGVEELRPDAVLLDVQLPDFDGFEVAARLRANDSPPAIILVSSREASDYGSLIEESGATGFISKGQLSGAAVTALLQR